MNHNDLHRPRAEGSVLAGLGRWRNRTLPGAARRLAALTCLALHLLTATTVGAAGGFDPGPGPAETCSEVFSAAAYVCCDGRGGFTVCMGRPGGSSTLQQAVVAHERDHLAWFEEHRPHACLARPAGSCRFQLTVAQHNDLECRGFRVEHEALTRALAGSPGHQVADILARQRQLARDAKWRFGCDVGPVR